MIRTAVDDQRIIALGELAAEELSRLRLLDFCKRVSPSFQTPSHIRYLAALLERAERGEVARLAISCAPGHGKSTLLQHFLAWFLGRVPKRRILAISASESLAKRNSRDAQAFVRSDGWPFPDVSLAGDSVLEWSTAQGGEVRAIGKGGTITGFRAEMILVDDLQSDAGSDTTQASDEEWFRSVLSTRLEPTGIVVIIQTRWADGDIVGRLLDGESRDLWTYVNLPAFAGANDPLGRAEGEELWPERWPRELLDQKRVEVGSSPFSAQYMGDPVPAGGAIFKTEWLSHRYAGGVPRRTYIEHDGAELHPGVWETSVEIPVEAHVILSIDAASKTGEMNDWTVIETLCSDERDYFIADILRQKLEFGGLCRAVKDMFHKWGPSHVFIEDASAGTPLIQELRRTTCLPIIAVPPVGSKVARATAITNLFEAGRVKFPESAPWLEAFVDEMLRFPYGRHDDQVDATTLGLAMLDAVVARNVSWREFAGVDLLER